MEYERCINETCKCVLCINYPAQHLPSSLNYIFWSGYQRLVPVLLSILFVTLFLTLCLHVSDLLFDSSALTGLMFTLLVGQNAFKLKTGLPIRFSNIYETIGMLQHVNTEFLFYYIYCIVIWFPCLFFHSFFTCICDASSAQTKNITKSSSWAAERKMSIS